MTETKGIVFKSNDQLEDADKHLLAHLEINVHIVEGQNVRSVLACQIFGSDQHYRWYIGNSFIADADMNQVLKLMRMGLIAQVDIAESGLLSPNFIKSHVAFALTSQGHTLAEALLKSPPVKLTPPTINEEAFLRS